MQLRHEPVALVLSRQNLPTIDRTEFASASGTAQGAYVLAGTAGSPDVVLLGTGSEVSLCLEARAALAGQGIQARVVSIPSWELFERQDEVYRDSVLPPSVTARVAVEQASTFGWERYTGRLGATVGMTSFGASAPLAALKQKFGFTVEHVVAVALAQVRQARASRIGKENR